jgi:hypothetical protein
MALAPDGPSKASCRDCSCCVGCDCDCGESSLTCGMGRATVAVAPAGADVSAASATGLAAPSGGSLWADGSTGSVSRRGDMRETTTTGAAQRLALTVLLVIAAAHEGCGDCSTDVATATRWGSAPTAVAAAHASDASDSGVSTVPRKAGQGADDTATKDEVAFGPLALVLLPVDRRQSRR